MYDAADMITFLCGYQRLRTLRQSVIVGRCLTWQHFQGNPNLFKLSQVNIYFVVGCPIDIKDKT